MTSTGGASRRVAEPLRSAATLADLDRQVLPLLSRAATREALNRLKPDEFDRALRQRWFPVAITPEAISYAIEEGARPPPGKTAVAQVPRGELLWALQDRFDARLKRDSTQALLNRFPEMSAARVFTREQTLIALSASALMVCAGMIWPGALVFLLRLAFCIFFLMVVAIKAQSVIALVEKRPEPPPALPPDQLPQFSVLIPLFRETEVLTQLLIGLEKIRYPRHKLDIKIIIETSDAPMLAACAVLRLPRHMEIIRVPQTGPQTKPKALNYALQFACGDIVTVFDAEDIPDPDQLLKAAAAFAVAPPEVVCLQAALHYYNADQNWLTRQFAIEYACLFDFVLPSLAMGALPLPLGGTSNHFRADALRKMGAWDPYNVTEDADLGLRMARLGLRAETIESVTHEEAASRLPNWIRQRARWQKGYMMTWLVHMRTPREIWRDVGAPGFFAIQAMILGTTLSALLHPLFLALLIWDIADGRVFPGESSAFRSMMTGLGLAILVIGYGTGLLLGTLAAMRIGHHKLLRSVPAMPLYWLLISLASWRALWDLIVSPHHWHKTQHGQTGFKPGRHRNPNDASN
jgi:glycosyltransferase XagB